VSIDNIGDQALLEGEPDDFFNWLEQFDKFAVGVGSPIMQQFTFLKIEKTPGSVIKNDK